jgi:hypothetical protein
MPKKEIKMSTISTTSHLTVSMKFFIVLSITLVAILAFVAVSSVFVSKPAFTPITENQNVYVDFLRGEKVIFAGTIVLNEVFSAYYVGEKAVYAGAVNSSNALSIWRLGEKSVAPSIESVLLRHRQGEKDIK